MAAIPAINGWTPDIAVLDINMPDMDGFAVARQLRQHRRTQHIVIVAFTAQDEFTIRANGIAAGFDGYCQKGAAPDALPDAVARLSISEWPFLAAWRPIGRPGCRLANGSL
jgi:CheY-like chemotaxis protein